MKLLLLIGIFALVLSLVSAERCEEIYYFIIETNYDYTETNLSNKNLTQSQIDNYPETCELEGHPKLPEKPIKGERFVNYSKCSPEIPKLVQTSIPFPKFIILPARKLSCLEIGRLKWFFSIEDEKIEGIRVWVIAVIFTILALIPLIKTKC